MSRGNTMSLKVSDEGLLPNAEDLLSYKKMAEFRSIETEGDGLKSYLATCVSLLLGKRSVCVIDEPELCLHPPQAYNLGKFIGQYGAGAESVTFVATHSSHLLRGILQTAQQVQIVRLTRREKTFSAYLVPSIDLSDALTRPTLRAEAVLDGIFAQAVAVVEADGDRVVYQAVWETLLTDFRMDLHFSTVGGTGGIADTCGLYRTLQIPIAVVSDLDVLTDSEKMLRILAKLVDDQNVRDELVASCAKVAEAVRRLPPTISPEAVSNEIAAIASLGMDWSKNDDLELKRRISKLAKDIDRSLRLKRGGVGSYDSLLAGQMNSVLTELRKVGLFLVPVGELEEWLADKNVGVSKSNKRAWSNAAAQRIQILGKQKGDIWDFVTEIGLYLASRPKVRMDAP
jgi:glycerol-3-phosphate cytidylyltransferase-like family protein